LDFHHVLLFLSVSVCAGATSDQVQIQTATCGCSGPFRPLALPVPSRRYSRDNPNKTAAGTVTRQDIRLGPRRFGYSKAHPGRSPNLRKAIAAGQKLVNALWIKFAPTNAVNKNQ
tara:strand:+ start:169594 stop:169938 length:345 start_codon:yes stop_codon:yes gene_type:complete